MAWDLEIVYSGLCLFYLPDDKRNAQVLLVKNAGHCCTHQPLLCFEPRDLDDLKINLKTVEPDYDFSVSQVGDHLAEVALPGFEVKLELEEIDEGRGLSYVENTGGSAQQPSGIFQERRRRDIRWIAPLHHVDQRIAAIDSDCLKTIDQVGNCPVAAKMYLQDGEVSSHRLGEVDGQYTLWSFYPDKAKEPVIQALADQVILRLKGLQDTATFHVTRGTGENQEGFYLKFPSDLDAPRPVRLTISNLPPTPEPTADELVEHLRAAYGLVKWASKPTGDHDLSVPKPFTANKVGGVNGGSSGGFCPCATCK